MKIKDPQERMREFAKREDKKLKVFLLMFALGALITALFLRRS